jgi:putative ABC transport system permease protein
MNRLRGFLARVAGLFGTDQRDHELTAELDSHIQMHIEENLQDGMTPEEARRDALVKLGGVEQAKESYRERRGLPWFETLGQDVRFGLRLLRKNPGFTAVAVLTLALGIGANTAIFSLTYQALLRDLPVPNAKQLVILRAPGRKPGHVSSDSDDATSFSYPEYKDIRDHAPAFSGLIARLGVDLSVAAKGTSERASGELVSGNYFDVLGVRPTLGRLFSPSDDTAPGANPQAVLSFGYWTRQFGGDPDILNKPLTVNGTSLAVVGVAQSGFDGVQFGRSTDVFVPISMKAAMTPGWDGLAARNDSWLEIIGRLKPGFTATLAQGAMAPPFHAIEESELAELKLTPGSKPADQFLARRLQVLPGEHGRPILQSNVQTPLLVLLTMVGLILLIACANLASLLLARGEARQREIAIKFALGAKRWRLVKQLLTESVLLALAGGAAGLLVASWTLKLFVSTFSSGMGVSGLETRLDPRLLIFAIAVSLSTAILFGLGPALRVTRASLPATLKDQVAASTSGANVELRKWLMVTQVALTATLLAAAGYFSKSLVNLEHQNLGVKVDHVVQFRLNPSLNNYTLPQTMALFDRIRQGIGQLPGVRSVSLAKEPVFEGDDWSSSIAVEDYSPQADEDMSVFRNSMAPDYFSTMGIPLLSGRDFRDDDSATNAQVVIVNQKLAEKYFAGRNPLGMHMAWGSGNSAHLNLEIVGVVQNSKHEDLRDTIHPFVYQPYAQDTRLGGGTFYVKTDQDPSSLAATLRELVRGIDSNLPISHVMTLEEDIDNSVFSDRMLTFFSLSLALLAAGLAAIGLYGVLAYMVTRRTKEIGIRIAIGATRESVAWLILREVVGMGAIGLALGMGAAFALGVLVESNLYGVKANDPMVFAATCVVLAATLLLAGWLPARKAANLDPTIALRHE